MTYCLIIVVISDATYYVCWLFVRSIGCNDLRCCTIKAIVFHKVLNLGRVANPRPVAKIKTGLVSQPITDANDETGHDRSCIATRPWSIDK